MLFLYFVIVVGAILYVGLMFAFLIEVPKYLKDIAASLLRIAEVDNDPSDDVEDLVCRLKRSNVSAFDVSQAVIDEYEKAKTLK